MTSDIVMKYGTTPIRWLAFLLAVSALGGGGPQCPAGETAPITAPLRVSANGHFFLDASNRPVFVLADTAWSLVNRLKREEITFYLEHRRAQGFNALAFVLYAPRNSDISHAPANAYGQLPFALVDGKADASKPLVTPGDDPAKSAEYDYWDHAAFALAETRRLGFYTFVLPCWGNEVVGNTSPGEAVAGKPAQQKFLDQTTARSFGRWLGQRYRAEPHVAWMLGGDRSAVDPTTGADFRPVFAAMAEGLRENNRAALISYHPQKAGLQSGDWFHAEPWLTFNSIQLWPEDQLAHGPISAAWFNPRTGQWHTSRGETDRQHALATNITAGPGAGEREFDPPAESGDGKDWVLVLERSPGRAIQ